MHRHFPIEIPAFRTRPYLDIQSTGESRAVILKALRRLRIAGRTFVDMSPYEIQTDQFEVGHFASGAHAYLAIDALLKLPNEVIEDASLQKFAKITPQYPGLRAALDSTTLDAWSVQLSPLLSQTFGYRDGKWTMIAWHSIVSTTPGELQPIQCFPHVDGTDPDQFAMMLYLDHTPHGGTAFFRHNSTGFEALTAETFPRYRAALEADVARTGLPPRRYITDGAPHFTRTHQTPGIFNQAVFYRGNLLHSGVIDNDAPLSPDPREGRYTINAFLRPPAHS